MFMKSVKNTGIFGLGKAILGIIISFKPENLKDSVNIETYSECFGVDSYWLNYISIYSIVVAFATVNNLQKV